LLRKFKNSIIISWFSSIIIFSQGSLLLVGGGSENYGDWSDKPYKWFVEHASNRKILILHYETTTTFFNDYLPSLSTCTVSNLAIKSITQANDDATYQFILQHDGIFLRGGDQAQYVAYWKGTKTEQAIKEVFQRGGVIGGTSAGEMVLSNVSYISGNTDSGGALRNPLGAITLVDDFLPLVPNALAESHTNERGRLGRLPVFLARYKTSNAKNIIGIAVDVNTALAIDKDGIGEVMGSSAVALMRWNPNTTFLIESGKSFALNNMKFDQLLPGYKFNFNNGEIIRIQSAIPYVAKQVSFPNGIIILDGSASPSDWSAPTGSLKKLQSLLVNPNDIIGIFSSTSTPNSANTIKSTFDVWGINSHLLLIDDNKKNDPILAASVNSCNAYIFVDNSLDGLSKFLDSSTLVGRVFISKVNSGKPLLFLSEDVMLAGEKVVGGIYSSSYSAYYGMLTEIDGLGLIKGIQLVPRLYQNMNNSRGYEYSENRLMGMFWMMGKSQSSYGLAIDAGTFVTIFNNQFEVGGVSTNSTPVILIDARKAMWTDFPIFQRPGKPNSLQNSALIGAYLHIIRPGDSNLLTTISKDRNSLPLSFSLEQNYPNPFNPSTKIRFSILRPGMVTLKIYDVLGREIAEIFNHDIEPGFYEKEWNASGFPSGVYFVKLDQTTTIGRVSKSIKIVLNK